MDLKKLNTRKACDQEVEIELKHPATGEPLGVFITVVGSESSRIAKEERNDKTPISDTLSKTTKEAMEKVINTAILGTVDWREFVFGGEELEYSETNVEKIYRKDGFDWIPAQVHRAINDLSLFMEG
jgi:hypothetical protein